MTTYKNLGPVKPWVQSAADEVGTMFHITNIGGYGTRSNVTDHDDGLALDFMTSDKLKGDAIAAYLIANRQRLAISYIIWQQRIFSTNDSKWEPMEDRGSPTANHMDHVHASFTADGKPRAGSGGGFFDPNSWLPGNPDHPGKPGNVADALIPNELLALGKGVQWLSDPANLIRIGTVILGGALVIFALFSWAGFEAIGKAGKSAVRKVA